MQTATNGQGRPRGRPSTARLIWTFLKLGIAAFGGLGATLSLLQRDLVEKHAWLASAEIGDALAYTRPLPGSTVVQIVTYLGWQLGGWPGALLATAAFLLPALAMMTTAAALFVALPDQPWVHGALNGVQVAVVGLLAAAMWRLARSEAARPVLVVVMLGSFVAGLFLNAAFVVAAAGAIGVAWGRWRPHA